MALNPLGIDLREIHPIGDSSHRAFIPRGIHSRFFYPTLICPRGIHPRAIHPRG